MRIVVKIGGTVAEDVSITRLLFDELREYGHLGSVVLVHGGGKAVTRVSGRLGITPLFEDGVRVTPPEEMEIVDMVLAGRVNTELVRCAVAVGVDAVGLTGADSGMLAGKLVGRPEENRTATVDHVSTSVINLVLEQGALPIVATVGTGPDGAAVNINADEAARAIAVALAAEDDVALCFLSDIPGVLDAERAVIPEISPGTVESLVESGVIQGGMAAKVRSSAAAVNAGLGRVVIGGFDGRGDLQRLLDGEIGTTVGPDKEMRR